METTLKIIIFALSCLFSLFGTLSAIYNGLKKRKTTKALTEGQQWDDVRRFMVNECSRVERFSKFLKNSMSKTELSDYKKTEVLKNLALYAKANGYSWYNHTVWELELKEYINNANVASGKTATQVANTR